MTVVGILYPGYAAEDDYPTAEKLLGPDVELPLVHTTMAEDAHRVDALLDVGRDDRLADGAARLRAYDLDSIVWACTSGSFVFGSDGARTQAATLADVAGVPASSTSIAFAEAIRALGLCRVAVAATYPDELASHFRSFLAADGVEVVGFGSAGIVTAAEVGELGRDDVARLALAQDSPDAEAVLLPDTALHTISWLPALERALGKPVLTANQVSVWEGLRLAGRTPAAAAMGALFDPPKGDAL